MEQLPGDQLHHGVQLLIEDLDVPVGLDAQAGQVDGGEAQVAPAAGYRLAGVVDVGHHPGAAAHVGHLGVIVPLPVEGQVEGGVQEAEIGEEPLGAGLDGQLEQVVVGVAGVVVDPLLHLEDLHRENGGLPVAHAGVGGQQQVAHDHPPLRGGVGAVVHRAEGHLGPRPGVHGVQVVDQGLHGLIGGLVRLGIGDPGGVPGALQQGLPVHSEVLQRPVVPLPQQLLIPIRVPDGGLGGGLLDPLGDVIGLVIGQIQPGGQTLGQGVKELLPEGLGHPRGHGVVKVGDALPAVHLVLVGLDGDAGQGGVAHDGLGGAQIPVAGAEPVLEQLDQVDLAAGLGEHVEVLVVDVDIPVDVGLGDVLGQDVVVHIVLGPLGAVLEHGAHGGVAVDVGVLPLDVRVLGVGIGQLVVDVHQVGLRLADLGVLRPVEDVGLGGLLIVVPDEHGLHDVLDLLHGAVPRRDGGAHLLGQILEVDAGHGFALDRLVGRVDGIVDLGLVKGYHHAVSLFDLPHGRSPFPAISCVVADFS